MADRHAIAAGCGHGLSDKSLLLFGSLCQLLLLLQAAALSFQYDFSIPGVLDRANLVYINDSFSAGDRISLSNMSDNSVGRVAYAQPVRLWDCRTGAAASFATSFSFAIVGNHSSTRGDGMAFFVGPFPATMPWESGAQYLGLYTNQNLMGSPPTVAVEFDTFWNSNLDPPGVADHVGIDVNSIRSANYTRDLPSLGLYGTMSANITYDAGSRMMAVSIRLADGSIHGVQTSVDLRAAGLPQEAAVGFSASTGGFFESHQLLSWAFNSTDMAAGNPNSTDTAGAGGNLITLLIS
ncbi:hypothetical protein PVAP13_5KG743201 [Panicum virgatum]|uniref:Legume lectin domain-containing protein n=1 Tax=Panicum virgatum TaxID=38727 RepID=A0A8T0SWJ7_PANVG|nr:hypothetical protein PVAP13_5KG743201 [Panicum virgatum]